MRTTLYRFAIAAAMLLAAANADAKPRRVVVLDFDGPRALADTGRTTVMAMLGDTYDVVATKRWESAKAQVPGRGPQQWSQAAKSSGVDAVIEGWVQDEGRHHVLTVAVRDATTGNEIDSISVRLGDKGVSGDANHQLQAQLDELLGWIDPDPMGEDIKKLPDARDSKPMIGSHQTREDRSMDRDDGGDDDDSSYGPRRRHDGGRRHGRRIADRDDRDDRGGDDRDVDRGGDRGDRGDRGGDRYDRGGDRGGRRDSDDEGYDDRRPSRRNPDARENPRLTKDSDAAKDPASDPSSSLDGDKTMAQPKVATAGDPDGKDTTDLVRLFGRNSDEADTVTKGKVNHVPKPTPKIMLGAGAFMASRGMNFDYDPGSESPPPSYPASGIKGIMVNAAVYPMPLTKVDGDLTGIGFTLGVSKSIGSVLTGMDDTGYGDYTIEHTAWEAGVHYRYPIDIITLDGEVNYGNISTAIVDLPQSIEIPDTAYSYLGAGLHLDLTVADHTTVGFGAKYLYMLSTGDVSSEDWYGAGTSYGYSLDANFMIPLPANLFVKGALEYRTVHIDFEGSGAATMAHGVWSVDDNSIGGSANIGIKF